MVVLPLDDCLLSVSFFSLDLLLLLLLLIVLLSPTLVVDDTIRNKSAQLAGETVSTMVGRISGGSPNNS